jgi:ABC-type transport system involved in multi-copper enzyme maturation permease subunit
VTSTAAPLPRELDLSGTTKVPFSRLVKVELRKSYDTRASFWLLAVIGIVVLLVEAIVLIVVVVQDGTVQFGDFVGAAAFLTSVLLPVLGIMLVTSEWSQRSAMVTFALEPRRSLIVWAKLVVGLILTLITALAATALGAVMNVLYAVLHGSPDWTFGWNFFFGFLIVQSLAMIGGFALATLLLNTPAAIVLFFVYKWVLPGIFAVAAFNIGWFDDASKWFDFQRSQQPVMDLTLNTGAEWAHLLVSGLIWLVLPLVLGVARILRAEVK